MATDGRLGFARGFQGQSRLQLVWLRPRARVPSQVTTWEKHPEGEFTSILAPLSKGGLGCARGTSWHGQRTPGNMSGPPPGRFHRGCLSSSLQHAATSVFAFVRLW